MFSWKKKEQIEKTGYTNQQVLALLEILRTDFSKDEDVYNKVLNIIYVLNKSPKQIYKSIIKFLTGGELVKEFNASFEPPKEAVEALGGTGNWFAITYSPQTYDDDVISDLITSYVGMLSRAPQDKKLQLIGKFLMGKRNKSKNVNAARKALDYIVSKQQLPSYGNTDNLFLPQDLEYAPPYKQGGRRVKKKSSRKKRRTVRKRTKSRRKSTRRRRRSIR